MFLDNEEKTKIQRQISEIESATDAEIVTVIAQSSDSYTFIPVLWAALLALCLPGIYYVLIETGFNNWLPDSELLHNLRFVYIFQVLLFLVLVMLFQWTPLQMLLIPGSVKQRRAHQQAQMQFLQQRVHWSSSRAGILLFVSVAEHYVEIIADQAVAEKVDDKVWAEAIEKFVRQVRSGQVAAGFSAAIEDCGKILLSHFPGSKRNPDELPNHLIEI